MKRKRNSINQIYAELKETPFQTEAEIMLNTFGFIRGGVESNKKYADMLRRGLKKKSICRINNDIFPIRKHTGKAKFLYFIPEKTPKVLLPKIGN